MPTEAVLNQLSSRKVTESLMMQIILHCAPVLKDIKMSSMFTVPAAYLKFVRSAFRGTGIRVKCLCQGAGRAVVYVYREAEVQQCLEDPQVAVFLQQYGYESTQAEACLNHLGARVSLSARGMEHYPHEMGIFLGYPLEDVRGFIRHEGKESRYTGYWKVYGDVTQAKQIFQAYDDAKECAVIEYMAGKHMSEIAC